MSASELASEVADALAVDAEAFETRAAEEAARLKSEIHDGTFDNTEAIVGLELELYAVDDRTDGLRRVPRHLLELIGFEKELGLHNAEMQTSPQPLNTYGLAAQEQELKANLALALDKLRAEDIRLVSDGMWTVPPTGETAGDYLRGCIVQDGVTLATNMSNAVRYHAMANSEYAPRMSIDAPNVHLDAETVMPESLITSIQPHYQVPHAPDLPGYFRYALRLAGPLLAVGVNSPLFPPDLYDDVADERILAEAHMEHRIGIFESVLNSEHHDPKVSFPPDFETVDDAVEDILADDTIVPMTVERSGRYDDEFGHFRHKHGSYWRWVRPVFDGTTRSAANARIEFRPLPAQPTLRDAISFQAVFAGLMKCLPQHEHPVARLDWETARDNFYAAARDGLDAELAWITADGEHTTATDRLYSELFEYARDGLERSGLSTSQARQYVRPLRERVDRRTTPARWKHDRVADAVAANTPLTEAIWSMQSQYIHNQKETLIEGCFADWLAA